MTKAVPSLSCTYNYMDFFMWYLGTIHSPVLRGHSWCGELELHTVLWVGPVPLHAKLVSIPLSHFPICLFYRSVIVLSPEPN